MNESEQAQAIADCKICGLKHLEIERCEAGVRRMMSAYDTLVDSQAQKYENLLAAHNVLGIIFDELKADREAQAVRLEKVESLYAIARTQIEEQAKEIEIERVKAQWSEGNVQDSFEAYASAIGIDIRRRVENHTEMNYLDDVCDVAWAAYLAAAKEFGNIK